MFNSSRLYQCAAFTVVCGWLGLAYPSVAQMDGVVEFDWGEPGGSRLVSDMADDFVEYFQWGEPGGSRSLEFCSITPYSFKVNAVRGGPFLLWSDRPLIVWQGEVSRIIVRSYIDDTKKLWTYEVNGSDTAVYYAGDELQPGHPYTLTFVGESGGEFSFELLGEDDRQAVGAELAQLEDRVRASGATAEELAMWRSRFFLQHDLRLHYDSLDALFSVDNPSPDLTQRLEQIRTGLCDNSVN